MTNVRRLARRISTDAGFRRALARAADQEARLALLAEADLSFTDAEFEDGVRAMLVECQTEEAAEEVREFRLWWDLLRST
jgi:hypothetical protein